jgi:hypothetical protein
MNQYVIDGLRVKLAETQADIRATEQRLRTLAKDKDTIARALRLFDPDAGQSGSFSLGIASGTFGRAILELLRDSPEPLCASEITDALASRSEKPLDKGQRVALLARVRNALARNSDRLDGELRGRTTYWRVR